LFGDCLPRKKGNRRSNRFGLESSTKKKIYMSDTLQKFDVYRLAAAGSALIEVLNEFVEEQKLPAEEASI
jgi:hypothetical protein